MIISWFYKLLMHSTWRDEQGEKKETQKWWLSDRNRPRQTKTPSFAPFLCSKFRSFSPSAKTKQRLKEKNKLSFLLPAKGLFHSSLSFFLLNQKVKAKLH